MTMLIMDTATTPTVAVDGTLRSSALASWWSDAAGACMAAGIIGTGRPVVHPSCRDQVHG
jgi:hypothetical protein